MLGRSNSGPHTCGTNNIFITKRTISIISSQKVISAVIEYIIYVGDWQHSRFVYRDMYNALDGNADINMKFFGDENALGLLYLVRSLTCKSFISSNLTCDYTLRENFGFEFVCGFSFLIKLNSFCFHWQSPGLGTFSSMNSHLNSTSSLGHSFFSPLDVVCNLIPSISIHTASALVS